MSCKVRDPERPLQPPRRRLEVVTRLVLVLAFLLAAAPLVAQSGSTSDIQTPTFRSGASLVSLNVTVMDGSAKYVTGLQSGDFAVFEDGVKQDVRFFESTAVPVDLFVLLDTSASMTDRMDVVHEAAIGFLRTLRGGDRGAVVSFSDTVTVVQPLTEDRSLLEKAIESTHAHGATALNNAIYIALKQFGQQAKQDEAVRRQAIAVLSDGEDTSSLVSFDDVLGLARKMGVCIYTVSLQSKSSGERQAQEGMRRYFSESDYSMKMLARETGAQSFFPALVTELKGVYGAIAAELASQYSIGYVPANNRSDGRFRRVVVQITTRPDLKPRTRLGYTAEGDSKAAPDHAPGGGQR
jgi:Ca-activated chloride channel family protein